MKLLFCIAAFVARMAHAQDLPPEKDCQFQLFWANKAYHIAVTIGLQEEYWTITPEGFPPDVYKIIQDIKREAYHDLPALRNRVETVCAEKEPT